MEQNKSKTKHKIFLLITAVLAVLLGITTCAFLVVDYNLTQLERMRSTLLLAEQSAVSELVEYLTGEPYLAWLEEIGMMKESVGTENTETAITITIGDTVLDGVIYDTALAQEIKEYFPLTISMSGFGGREYYGGVDFYPTEENLVGGGNTFDNGDITYCEAHHNMAVFYAQTDNPVLSVDVIPIGRVTSDLSVFENLESREEITFSLAE